MNRDSGFSSFYVFCAIIGIGFAAGLVVVYQERVDEVESFSASQVEDAQECLDEAYSKVDGGAMIALKSLEGVGLDPDSYVGRYPLYDEASDFCRDVDYLVLAEMANNDAE